MTRAYTHAFTLVELLVVIGIIAVLIAILLPALSRARESANTAACLSNQRQLAIAMLQYANDNKLVLPPYGVMKGNDSNELPENYWWQLVSKYVSKSNQQPGVNFMRCPSDRDPSRASTYAVNYGQSHIGGVFTYYTIGFSHPGYLGSQRVTKVKGGTFLTADTVYWTGGANLAIYSPLVWPLDVDKDGDGLKDSSSTFAAKYNHLDPRHGNGAVCSFIDGSARRVPLKEWIANKDKIWGR